MLTVALALVIFVFVYLTVGRYSTLSGVGAVLFSVMGGFGMAYGLLAGPLATADCLSRERREGTLGLLFLTDLRSYDVVLGKMGAASLDLVFSLVAAMPVVAIPILLGGISLVQFMYVTMALLDIMFLSLAVGVCASAFWSSGRAALGVTVVFLAVLTIGLPIFGEEVLGIRNGSRAEAWFNMTCPLWAMVQTLGIPFRISWKYWLNLGGMHLLAWVCLFIACRRTRNSWRDLPLSGLALRLRQWLEALARGSRRARLAWRQAMLDKNPVHWLEGRDRLQQRALWSLCLLSAIVWAGQHLQYPRSCPNMDAVILWPMWSHYILCLWLAIQAPRRLADDKQSGALELLLCTPLPDRQIVRGGQASLRIRFGRALLGLMALDGFLVYAYITNHGGWPASRQNSMIALCLCVLIVFPLQAYSFARLGLYQGLVRANSLRATFVLVWRLGLLPWFLFVGLLLAYDLARRPFPIFRRLDDIVIFGTWIVIHVLVCAGYLARANWQLHRHFRSLAAQTVLPPWWQRAWRFLRRQSGDAEPQKLFTGKLML